MTHSRWYLASVAVALSLALGAAAAFAARDEWRGRPDFVVGQAHGYFVWEDDEGWHVRWTNKGERKRSYTGTITCSGSFTRVRPYDKDRKDTIRQEGRSRIVFNAHAQGQLDGVNFEVSGSTQSITFDLRVDGQRAPTDQVKIGKGKRNPSKVPFTLGEPEVAAKPVPVPAGKKPK